jgi:hypothetical protein
MAQGDQIGALRLGQAMVRLKSLQEGFAGVSDVIACGRQAIPALRAILVHTETSGIFEVRVRAVAALKALGANDVLINFLDRPHWVADPTARCGEEAVVNAVARALIGVGDARVFSALTKVADRRSLAGVMEALGATGRPEAIPWLIFGLAEDEARRSAESALRGYGGAALAQLAHAAWARQTILGRETSSSLRARRSAAELMAEISVAAPNAATKPGPALLEVLAHDEDPLIAACALLSRLATSPISERRTLLDRLESQRPRLAPPGRAMVENLSSQISPDAAEEDARRGPG